MTPTLRGKTNKLGEIKQYFYAQLSSQGQFYYSSRTDVLGCFGDYFSQGPLSSIVKERGIISASGGFSHADSYQ